MTKDITQISAFLLEQSKGTIRRFEESYKQSGEKYNIFKIANIYTDEVIICRVIGDLLDPNGNHCKGDYFLKYFIDILNEKMSSPLAVNTGIAKVKNEYVTNINRRIDIVIDDGNIFLPIEVKIYAGDQEKQVSHYAEFSRLKNKGRKVPVVYLTIEGNPPSNANEGEFIPISFQKEVLKWLNKCLRNGDIERTKPVFEILKQLIASIKSICGISEDEKMEKAIQGLVTQSSDNIKAALAISQALDTILNEADEKAWDLFQTKVLSQLQKTFPSAASDEDTYDKWFYIYIPIKNGRYNFGLNYDWRKMYITDESNGNSNAKEINALNKKLTDLTGIPSRDWSDYVWGSDKYLYPSLKNIDTSLYLFNLSKEYLENTTEVVNQIISIAKELDNA